MEKIRSEKLTGILSLLKACLIGIVVSLFGVVVLAVVLKFCDISSNLISYLNNIIKGVSIFVMILLVKRADPNKLVVKSIVAGLVYALLSFIIFSVLDGAFAFNLSLLYDILFAVIAAVICSVILNLAIRKN